MKKLYISVVDIEYDIASVDEDENGMISEDIQNSLPNSFEFEIDESELIDTDILSTITDLIVNEVGVCVRNFDFFVLEDIV